MEHNKRNDHSQHVQEAWPSLDCACGWEERYATVSIRVSSPKTRKKRERQLRKRGKANNVPLLYFITFAHTLQTPELQTALTLVIVGNTISLFRFYKLRIFTCHCSFS